jgi:chromosome segregation ATPase
LPYRQFNHPQENNMLTRKEYVEQLKNNLDKWNADLAHWEEKARAKKNDLTINYEMTLEDLRKKRGEAADKLKELQASSEEAFKELKAGADTAWTAMREAFDKARAHFEK